MRLSQPEFGPASRIQPIAPRYGGVTNAPSTRSPDDALARHVGARNRPGDRHGEHQAQHGNPGAEAQRVQHRGDVARTGIGGDVVHPGEDAGVPILQAGLHQPEQRVHHQENKDGGQRDPKQDQWVKRPGTQAASTDSQAICCPGYGLGLAHVSPFMDNAISLTGR